jgi:hypothetical protein
MLTLNFYYVFRCFSFFKRNSSNYLVDYFKGRRSGGKNIKRRYLINQIGGARPKTRSVTAQNQVLNAPVSSGTRSRTSLKD